MSTLDVGKLAFCERVESFGVYTPRQVQFFQTGSASLAVRRNRQLRSESRRATSMRPNCRLSTTSSIQTATESARSYHSCKKNAAIAVTITVSPTRWTFPKTSGPDSTRCNSRSKTSLARSRVRLRSTFASGNARWVDLSQVLRGRGPGGEGESARVRRCERNPRIVRDDRGSRFDFVRQRSPFQSGQQVLDRQFRHPLPCLHGGTAEMWRDDHVVESQQRMIAGQRFGIGHIECRGVNPPLQQGCRSAPRYPRSVRGLRSPASRSASFARIAAY